VAFLEITTAELALPPIDPRPRLGAPVSEWVAHKARERKLRASLRPKHIAKAPTPPVEAKKPPSPAPAPPLTAAERLAALPREPLYEGRPSIRFIVAACCAYYAIGRLDLISPRRSANMIRPRHVAIYLARHMTIHALPTIAKHFGGRDHSTILYACHRIGEFILTDDRLRAEVAAIKGAILGEAGDAA
jgi:hypothetical protein